jgi:hypothetical protein
LAPLAFGEGGFDMAFWTVFGLCCIDGNFRNRIVKVVTRLRIDATEENPDGTHNVVVPALSLKRLNDFLKGEGFLLSGYELGELARILSIREVPMLMESVELWSCCEFPCRVAQTYRDDYDYKSRESKHIDRGSKTANKRVLEYKRGIREDRNRDQHRATEGPQRR